MEKKQLNDLDIEAWSRFVEEMQNGDTILPFLDHIKVLDLAEETAKIEKEMAKNNTNAKYQAVYDLHGMTRNEAYQYLETQLSISKLRGYHCVLVITGKGHGKGEGLGILKRKVPMWLEGAKFNKIVRCIEPASMRDGGEGALYVYLR